MADNNNKRKAVTAVTARKRPRATTPTPTPLSSPLKPLPEPNLRNLSTNPTTFQPISTQRFPRRISPWLPDIFLGIFQLFCPVDLVEEWAEYTNVRYIRLPGHVEGPRTKYSRQHAWTPTTVDEIYLFFGMLLYMSIHHEPRLEHYWSKKPTAPLHPIARLMPRNRF